LEETFADTMLGEISFNPVYFPQYRYNVSAGLAPFNVSYTRNLAQEWSIEMCNPNPVLTDLISYSMDPLPKGQGQCVSSTTETPQWIPCEESVFLSGGFLAVAPQPDLLTNGTLDGTAHVISNTQGYHLEFGDIRDLQSLKRSSSICATIGDEGGALYWCLAKGRASEFFAGMVHSSPQYTFISHYGP
jgi:hypothetical protein